MFVGKLYVICSFFPVTLSPLNDKGSGSTRLRVANIACTVDRSIKRGGFPRPPVKFIKIIREGAETLPYDVGFYSFLYLLCQAKLPHFFTITYNLLPQLSSRMNFNQHFSQRSILFSNFADTLPVSLSHARYERTVLPHSAYCSKFSCKP